MIDSNSLNSYIRDSNSLDKTEIAISLISQYIYCSRRAALIALYNEWGDNEHTVAGTIEHERVHDEAVFGNGTVRTYHGVRVSSDEYGLVGVCDRVDLETDTRRYIPIEFKHGKRRNEIEYEAQLCAQVLCLEEMFCCSIRIGYLFFVSEKRRKEVEITESLRKKTLQSILEIRDLMKSEALPQAKQSPKCRECSLADICVPQGSHRKSCTEYLKNMESFAQGDDEATAGGIGS